MKRLMYIWLILLLAANLSAQESYVIDSVCIGSVRNYRIDGEKGSTFEWFILDTLGNQVDNPSNTTFVKPGDTINISEITYTWSTIGEFDIRVLHYSEHGCDTLEQGRVKVYESPFAEAGPDQTVCSTEAIFMKGDTAGYYSTLQWITRGDGTFDVTDQLHPQYFRGTNDSIAGTVTLVLIAEGLAHNGTCEAAMDSLVIIFSDPVLTFETEQILCFNDSTGSIKVNITGATLPYTIAWTGPDGFTASTDFIDNIKAGIYYILLTDAVNCIARDTVEITEPVELIAIIDSVKNVTCYNGNDGVAIVNVTGGVAPYSYTWSGTTITDSVATGLTAGIYQVTVTDASGCVATDTVEITQPDELLALIDSTQQVSCYDGSDGMARVTVSGGTGNYQYEWNTTPVQDSSVAINLAEGVYIVKVTDENGCTAADTIIITQPLPLALSADSLDARCGGKQAGSIDLTVSGGTPFVNAPHYLFEWHDDSGIIATSEDLTDLTGDRLYWVYVTDSLGCIDSLEMYINDEKNVKITLEAIDSILCYNDSTGAIDISVSLGKKPYSFVWYNAAGDSISNTEDLVNIPAGFYRVVVNDANLCDEEMNFTLNNPAELLAGITGDSVLCENETTALNGNPAGGTGTYTHLWTGTGAAFLIATDIPAVNFTGTTPGDYTLIYRVTDENACAVTDTFNLIVNPITNSTYDTLLCAGELPFIWNDSTYTVFGTFTNTVKNIYDCDSVITLNIIEIPPTTGTYDTLLCAGEFPFIWNDSTYTTFGTFTNIVANSQGCDSVITFTINEIPPVTIALDTLICEGIPAFAWNSHTVTSAHDSIYTEILTTPAGCDSTVILNVTILPGYTVSVDTMICKGSSDFVWNGINITSVKDSIYSVTLPTAAQCDSIIKLNVVVLPIPETIIDTAICQGEPVIAWNSHIIQTTTDSTYIDTLTAVNSCDSVVQLNVTILLPTELIIDTTICQGEPAFAWNSHFIQTTTDSTYIEILTAVNSCDSVVHLNVTILPPTELIIDTTICQGEPVFAWNSHFIQTTTDSTYIEILTAVNSCDSVVQLNVTILPPTELIMDTTLCQGEPVFAWNSHIIQTITDSTYIETLTAANSCDSVVQLNVTILPPTELIIDTTICQGEPVFAWNSHIIQTSTDSTYIDTLTAVNSCDSVVHLNVTILPPTELIIDTTICQGEPVFAWNSHIIQTTTDSTYIDTLATMAGCDSVITLNVMIAPVDTTITDTTLIWGSPVFAWNSHIIQTNVDSTYIEGKNNIFGCDSILIFNVLVIPGDTIVTDTAICKDIPVFAWNNRFIQSQNDSTYVDTLYNASGFPTIAFLNVTILPVDQIVIDTTLCQGTPVYTWNSHIIQTDSDSTYIENLTNLAGCDSVITLNVHIIAPVMVAIDTSVCQNEPVFAWNSHQVLTTIDSLYTDTLTMASGCDSIVTLSVKIIPVMFTDLDTLVCQGSPTFTWNSHTIGTIRDSIYNATLLSSLGCDSLVTLNVKLIPALLTESDTMLCEGSPVFSWHSHIIQTSRDSSYTETFGYTAGCDSTVILHVKINPVYLIAMDTTICMGSPAFAWNSHLVQTLSDSSYVETLTSTFNCDSTITLNVKVVPEIHTSKDTVICQDTPPFVWFGQTIPTSADGVYVNTLTSVMGCDSIVTLNVSVVPPVTIVLDTALCQGTPYLSWNNLTVQTLKDSIYTVNLQNINGCDSTMILNVSILPAYNITTDTILCLGSPEFEWNSQTVSTAKDSVYFTSFTNSTGCDSALILNVKIVTFTASVQDTVLCSGSPSFTWNGQTILTDVDRTYQAVLINSYGCDSLLTLNVSITTTLTPQIFSIGPFCQNSVAPDLPAVTLNGITGTWSPATINTSLAWTRTFTFTPDPGQCALPVSIDIEILRDEDPVLTPIGPLCQFSVAPVLPKVSANGIPGTWSPDTIMTDKPGVFDFIFTPDPAFICSEPQTLQVEILPSNIAVFDSIGPFCQYEIAPALPATGKNGISGTWSPAFINTDNAGVFTYTFTPGNSYSCASPATLFIKVIEETPLTFDPIDPLCQFSVAGALPAKSKEGISGTWSPAVISTDSAGTFNFIFTPVDTTLCIRPVSVNVIVTPAILLSAKVIDDKGETVPTGSIDLTITGGTPPFNIIWSNGKTTEDLTGLSSGEYTVVVTDQNGCQNVLTRTIIKWIPTLVIDCAPAITVGCFDELVAYPPFADFDEFVAAGGSVTSNCGIDTASFKLVSTDTVTGSYCLNIERTYSIKDSCGLTETCIHYLYLDDKQKPIISCPDNITADCPPTSIQNIDNIADFIAAGGDLSDNCMLDSLSFTVDTVRIPLAAGYRIETTFSIKDKCGNENTCTHLMTIADTIPPVAVCNSITVYLNNSGIYDLTDIDIRIIIEGSSDNCTKPEDLTYEVFPRRFTCENVENGANLLVNVYDAAGNKDFCMVKINIADSIPPTAICKDITVYLDEHGKASITALQINNNSTDNCAIDTLFLDRYDFGCADVGINPVTLTVVDKVSLQDQCIANVTVIDTMKPVVTCNGPFEIQLDENAEYKLTVGEIASTYPVDACGLDTVYVFPHELDCDHIGLTTVTLAAVGVNGDTAYCQTVVEIFGNRPPNVLPDSAITDENTPVEIDVVANDTDEKTNIDISSQRIVIQPKWGTAVRNPINGVITYTPNRNFNGVDILQYEICDDGIPCDPECGRTYVYIKVNAVNEPPVAEDDYLSADCSSVSQNLLWNDSDPDNDVLTINTNPLVPPQHGVAMIDADGMLNYFPNDGFIGRDSLQYVVCDNGIPSMCDTAWVYIDVDCNEENQNPIECILFVPEGFSPNGDGIHEFFRVMCIHLYPEATMRIFNRNGNLLWMKENYGNYDVWGDAQNAWWWGNTTYRWDQGNRSVPGQEGKLVKVGNYVWVLELGNGEIKNGTVMVAY